MFTNFALAPCVDHVVRARLSHGTSIQKPVLVHFIRLANLPMIRFFFSSNVDPTRIRSMFNRFALDLVVVVMDWIFIFLRGVTMLRIGKSRRLLRIIRTVRIVRSVKMVVKLAQMLDSFRSEGLRILLNIVALALCVLTINHYFACGWYYVGTASDPANNWILKNVDQEL